MIILWQLRQAVKSADFWGMLFAPVGVGWTVASILIQLGYAEYVDRYLKCWWVLLLVGMVIGIIRNWPKRSVSRFLPNIDTEVEVRVGNIFRSKHPMVVGIPTTLETSFDENAISPESIQGQFTKKYCGGSESLARALQGVSRSVQGFELTENFYSNGEEIRKYPAGEVFVVREFRRVGYLVTLATFNTHGTAQTTQTEFLDCLPRLWMGIRERGDIGTFDVPLMGSKFARSGIENRKEILRELINSFSAASADFRLADKVTFFIQPSDFTRWDFSFDYIERLLENICDEHRRKPLNGNPVGQGLDGQ